MAAELYQIKLLYILYDQRTKRAHILRFRNRININKATFNNKHTQCIIFDKTNLKNMLHVFHISHNLTNKMYFYTVWN